MYIKLDDFYPPRSLKDSVATCSTAERPRFTAWWPATLKKSSENTEQTEMREKEHFPSQS